MNSTARETPRADLATAISPKNSGLIRALKFSSTSSEQLFTQKYSIAPARSMRDLPFQEGEQHQRDEGGGQQNAA